MTVWERKWLPLERTAQSNVLSRKLGFSHSKVKRRSREFPGGKPNKQTKTPLRILTIGIFLMFDLEFHSTPRRNLRVRDGRDGGESKRMD